MKIERINVVGQTERKDTTYIIAAAITHAW